MAEMKDRTEPLYMIRIVARRLGVHPQTLRVYEKEGLITPQRVGRQRFYSEQDIERLRMILRLTRELGVNRAGVDIILRMRQKIELLQRELQEALCALDEDIREELEERIRRLFE